MFSKLLKRDITTRLALLTLLITRTEEIDSFLINYYNMFDNGEHQVWLKYLHTYLHLGSDYRSGFGFVTGAIGHLNMYLQLTMTLSPINTSLDHALSFHSLLSLHQSSGNGFRRRTFPNCPHTSAIASLY
jgi:hypothetical protein